MVELWALMFDDSCAAGGREWRHITGFRLQRRCSTLRTMVGVDNDLWEGRGAGGCPDSEVEWRLGVSGAKCFQSGSEGIRDGCGLWWYGRVNSAPGWAARRWGLVVTPLCVTLAAEREETRREK
jgi:hypothetical protein